MDLNYTPEEQAFRAEVRAFVTSHLPADIGAKVKNGKRLHQDDFVRWQKVLHQKGWGATMWPVKFGGTGWTAVQQHIFEEECAEAGAPMQLPFGLRMVAPVIMAFGSKGQQEHFLPRIVHQTKNSISASTPPASANRIQASSMRAILAARRRRP